MRRIAVWLVALGVAGCVQMPQPLWRIGSNVWPGYEPLYFAREKGWLEGLDLRLIELTNSSDVIDGIRAGVLEGGMLTLDEVVQLTAGGVPMTVVLVIDMSSGADAVVACAEVQTLADLRGRRIAVEDTALGTWHLALLLQKAGLREQDVRIVHAPIDKQTDLWLEGKVDAAITFEPVKSQLLAAGGHVIFDSSEIPGKIVDVLALRSEVMRTPHARARVQQIRTVWLKALAFMNKHPRAYAELASARLGAHPNRVLEMYRGLRLGDARLNAELMPHLAETAAEIARVFAARGVIRHRWSPESLAILPWEAP